jgi:hypothetical protein
MTVTAISVTLLSTSLRTFLTKKFSEDMFISMYYSPDHQITSFKVTAKSYNLATRTAEPKPVEHFVELLTSTCYYQRQDFYVKTSIHHLALLTGSRKTEH